MRGNIVMTKGCLGGSGKGLKIVKKVAEKVAEGIKPEATFGCGIFQSEIYAGGRIITRNTLHDL